MESFVLCFLSILCYLGVQGQVISEPDDVTVCNGTASTSLTCVLNGSIDTDDVQWYRLIKGTNTAQRVSNTGDDFFDVPIPSQNNFTTILYIHNAVKSFTGYYWVRSPLGDVCNTSFTVSTGPTALTVNIMKNTENLSIIVQWDEVDDSLTTNYIVNWTSNGTNSIQSHSLIEQSPYTITGLTLNTVYTITVTASDICGTGLENRISVSFSADNTSSTSSDSSGVMSIVNPTTMILASFTIITTTDVTMSSEVTTDSTTSNITNLDVTIATTSVSTVNATTFVIESSSIITTTTTTLVMNPSISTISATTTITTTASTTTTATTTAANNTSTNVVATTTATLPDIVMSPTSSVKPADTTATDESSGDDNIAYLIVGATLGGIIILSLLIVMFCCFGRSKSDIFNKIKFSPLKDKSTTDKNIPMAPNPLSANDDDDKKPAKLEAETSHQTSATLEQPVMPDMESIVDSNINSQLLEPSDTYDKLGPPRPLDQCDSDDRLPSLIKDDDTCDKDDGGLHSDEPPCSDANQKNDVPVDDPQKSTYDVPVVTVPCVDGPTTDGANHNKTDGRLNYAVLDTLPAPTDNYIRKDNSDVTAYAIVT